MSPKAQRIAIAEVCGWKPDDDGDGTGWKGSQIGQRLIGKKPTFSDGKVVSYLIEQTVPDYLNDLNAMSKAESFIIIAGASAIRLYEDALQKHVANIVFASAAQRAEAFLKTLDLWKP